MKNRIILIAASIAAMVVSCQKEVVPTSNVKTEPMVLTSGVETKTILNGNQVLWTPGDKIMVIDNKGGINEFAIDNTITGNVEKAIFSGEVVDQTSKFLAVYPSTCVDVKNSSYTTSTIVTIPVAQTPKAGSFETNHNVTVAHGSKEPGTAEVTGVQFKNVGGLLKFTLPTTLTNIKKVSLSSTTAIAGQMKVTPNNDGFTTEFVGTAKEVIMTPGENGYFTCVGDANTFWFAVAPVSLTDLTISVIDGNGNSYSMTKTWAVDSPLKIEAGKYKNLGTIDMKVVSAAAAHTYTNDILDGTQITVNFPEADKPNITSINLKLLKGESEVTGWNAITSAVWTKPKSYPYLPKGEYTLAGTYTLKNGTVVTIGNTTVKVDAPTFTVTPAQARTTYTVATSQTLGGPSAANNLNALTITHLHEGVVPGISDNIWNNEAYQSLKGGVSSVITNAFKSITTTAESYDFTSDINNESTNKKRRDAYFNVLGTNTVVSRYTFDSSTCDSQSTSYFITGLPFTLDVVNYNPIIEISGWDISDRADTFLDVEYVVWGVDYQGGKSVRLGYWVASADPKFTIKFEVPESESLNVSATISGDVVSPLYQSSYKIDLGWFGSTGTNKWKYRANTCTITLGDSSKSISVNSADEYTTKPSASTTTMPLENISGVFTSQNSSISVHDKDRKTGNYTYVTSMKIQYN